MRPLVHLPRVQALPILGFVLAAVGLQPRDLLAQARQRPDSSRSLEAVARTIVQGVPYPTFITTDATGRPQARTIQPLPPDGRWTVWFATNPRTRKVTEVARDPRVVLHYFDPKTLSYVSLIGEAHIVRDRDTKAAHWDKAWDAFYPDRDTSVVLMEIRAERLEVVSATLGIAGDPRSWRPPTVQLAPRAVPRPSRSRRRP